MMTTTGAAQDIVRAMCLYPASSAYGRSHGYTEDFVHGVYKWDFSGLIPSVPPLFTLSSTPSSVPSLSAFSTPSSSSSSFPLASTSSLPYTSFGLQASSGLPGYTSASVASSSAKGTLEFRQAPGSQTAEEARTYVELAVSFFAGAIALGFGSDTSAATMAGFVESGAGSAANGATNATGKHKSNGINGSSSKGKSSGHDHHVLLEEMWWLLSAGAQSSGIGDLRGVERLFSSARGGGARKGKK
jgi:hypothetical protein